MTTKIANPPLPPELRRRVIPCGTEGCDWPARYRRGSDIGCARHGPMATHCPTCGSVARWFDLTRRPHCAACDPEPPLAEQIAQMIARAAADPRTAGHAATLRTLAETITQATRRIEVEELARQQAGQDVQSVGRQRTDALVARRRILSDRDRSGHHTAEARRRLVAADDHLRDLAGAVEEAGTVERDHRRVIHGATRRRTLALAQVRQIAGVVLQIQAKPATEPRTSILARVLGRG